uniref:PilZ domain-containing protein n=1 Tax=Nicotiana tabacum TaxID=4097 RepID=A0A1S3X2H4_TOBAC|nr:PREDICTED: uncharacterized protein LOC107760543 [Nicotiana tabacum]
MRCFTAEAGPQMQKYGRRCESAGQCTKPKGPRNFIIFDISKGGEAVFEREITGNLEIQVIPDTVDVNVFTQLIFRRFKGSCYVSQILSLLPYPFVYCILSRIITDRDFQTCNL